MANDTARVADKLKSIIDLNGPSFLVSEPYKTYLELIESNATDRETSGAIRSRARREGAYEWGICTCIPEMVRFVEDLELTDADLAQVTSLTFDGGSRTLRWERSAPETLTVLLSGLVGNLRVTASRAWRGP